MGKGDNGGEQQREEYKLHDDGVDGCNAVAMETMAGDDDNKWVAVVVFEIPEFMSFVERPKVSINLYHELAIPMLY